MEKEEEEGGEDSKKIETEGSITGGFFIFLFFSLISYFIYVRSVTYYFAFFIFLIGFELSAFSIFAKLSEENPSNPLFKNDILSAGGLSLFAGLIPVLLVYYFTKSIVMTIASYFLFIFGLLLSGLRNNNLLSVIFLILTLPLFYYSYVKGNMVLYLTAIFLFLYFLKAIIEYIKRNLWGKAKGALTFPSYMLVISLSFAFFSLRFLQIDILFWIGILASVFFGFFVIEFSSMSLFKDTLFREERKERPAFAIACAIFSIILFGVFIFFEKNIIIYIIASLCLSVGAMDSKLILRRFLSEHLSFELSICMVFGILGICTIIFYFIFIKETNILFLGIGLVIFASKIAYKEIQKDKLNINFDHNL
jgi:hypothetical protein